MSSGPVRRDAAAAAAGTGPSHAVSGDKDRWRKLVELRIFARVCGEDGLAAKCGVRHVNDKAYDPSRRRCTRA